MTVNCDVPIVAFTGPAGAGKTCAAYALSGRGFMHLKFADGLKNMMRSYYRTAGLDALEIEKRIEGDLKEVPDPFLGGKTPRFAMQTLGTEWGREQMGHAFWVNAWRQAATNALSKGLRVVVDDVRFGNEAAAVRDLGGAVVGIGGRSKGLDTNHASERFDLKPDMVITNTGSRSDFTSKVRYTFNAPYF